MAAGKFIGPRPLSAMVCVVPELKFEPDAVTELPEHLLTGAVDISYGGIDRIKFSGFFSTGFSLDPDIDAKIRLFVECPNGQEQIIQLFLYLFRA